MKTAPVIVGKVSKRTGVATALLLCVFLIDSSLASDGLVIREDGAGPVRIGMSIAELRAALHANVSKQESGSENCFYVNAPDRDHVSFMIVDGTLVRIDVDAPGVATSSGIQVGDSEGHARQVYGAKLKVTEHAYVDTGHYLTVRSADGRYGVRFETDKGKITRFYAGKYDAIQYVEGCE